MAAGALESLVDQIIAAHADQFEMLRNGDNKKMGFFVGLIMDATNKQANGKEVTALLRQKAGLA